MDAVTDQGRPVMLRPYTQPTVALETDEPFAVELLMRSGPST